MAVLPRTVHLVSDGPETYVKGSGCPLATCSWPCRVGQSVALLDLLGCLARGPEPAVDHHGRFATSQPAEGEELVQADVIRNSMHSPHRLGAADALVPIAHAVTPVVVGDEVISRLTGLPRVDASTAA